MLVIQWGILSHVRGLIGITDEWFHNSWNMELYVLISISMPIWFYFTYFDSHKSKGSFGKRILKLSVVDLQGDRIHWRTSFGRTLLKLLPWEVTHIGAIFPTPIYFEDNPELRILSIIGLLLLMVYAGSILQNRHQRSIHDRLMGTRVVE